MARIMLVDDEENILNALRRVLASPLDGDASAEDKNIVETFTSPHAALDHARDGVRFDVVISDYRMPEMDGVAFLKALREHQPDAVRIILSGYADMKALIGAINEANIQRFIVKPWDDYSLCTDVRQLLELQQLQLENRRLADEVRQQQGIISQQELELRRLEAETPGITKVNRTPDGSVILDDDF